MGPFLGGCFGCDNGPVGDNGENTKREMDEKEEGMTVLILDAEFSTMFYCVAVNQDYVAVEVMM